MLGKIIQLTLEKMPWLCLENRQVVSNLHVLTELALKSLLK